MTSQEFLEILGDVDEKYVLAADENVVRPRFRWQPWAACAACAALICVAAWPNFKGGSNGSAAGVAADTSADCAPPMEDESADAVDDAAVEEPAGVLIRQPGLHDYFLFGEERALMTTAGDAAAPAGGVDDAALEKGTALDKGPVPEPAPAPNAESPVSGAFEDAQAADIPYDPESGALSPPVEEPLIDQDEATRQYQSLLQNAGISYAGEGYYPEWFGGAWLDNDWPDYTARLTVAMVEGWRTEAMESMVRDWCGGTGDVLFCTAKYSLAYLEGVTDEVAALFDRYGWLPGVIDANEVTNRVDLEIYGSVPSDEFLAELAKLDPEGDVIRVQVFADRTIRFTDGDAVKPAAEPEPAAEPDGWEEDIPADPGLEEGQPGEICELPLAK